MMAYDNVEIFGVKVLGSVYSAAIYADFRSQSYRERF